MLRSRKWIDGLGDCFRILWSSPAFASTLLLLLPCTYFTFYRAFVFHSVMCGFVQCNPWIILTAPTTVN